MPTGLSGEPEARRAWSGDGANMGTGSYSRTLLRSADRIRKQVRACLRRLALSLPPSPRATLLSARTQAHVGKLLRELGIICNTWDGLRPPPLEPWMIAFLEFATTNPELRFGLLSDGYLDRLAASPPPTLPLPQPRPSPLSSSLAASLGL